MRFWDGIRAGLLAGEAIEAAGLSKRARDWFAEAGGIKALGPGPVSGRYLSVAEREEIALGLAQRKPVRQIARELGRPASTVSREVRRNSSGTGSYRALAAQFRAEERGRRPKTAKLAGDDELRGWVQGKLRKRWSPEQISRAWRRSSRTGRRCGCRTRRFTSRCMCKAGGRCAGSWR